MWSMSDFNANKQTLETRGSRLLPEFCLVMVFGKHPVTLQRGCLLPESCSYKWKMVLLCTFFTHRCCSIVPLLLQRKKSI